MKWYEDPANRLLLVVVIVGVFALMMSACTTLPKGITMSPEEAKACEKEGCTVWTMDELKNLARQFYLKGRQDEKGST